MTSPKTSVTTLLAIQRTDPDGGQTEPTDAEYAQFEQAIARRYGQEALDDYYGSAWTSHSPI